MHHAKHLESVFQNIACPAWSLNFSQQIPRHNVQPFFVNQDSNVQQKETCQDSGRTQR